VIRNACLNSWTSSVAGSKRMPAEVVASLKVHDDLLKLIGQYLRHYEFEA